MSSLLYRKLEAALATGFIALLQIRRKQILALPDGESRLYEEARQIVELAKAYNVPVVINDNIKLAAKLGVGVHLGQQDGEVTDAKHELQPNQVIGRTCHGKIELVEEAKNEGVSYAAMGAIFTSNTKPNANVISRQQLIDGCQQNIAICVIGGLTAECHRAGSFSPLLTWRSLAILWIYLWIKSLRAVNNGSRRLSMENAYLITGTLIWNGCLRRKMGRYSACPIHRVA